MLHVVNRLLVIVATENQIDAEVGERAQHFLGVLETMSLTQFTTHRIVVHHHHPCRVVRRRVEASAKPFELRARHVTDDAQVTHVPRQCPAGDAVTGVQPDEARASDIEHGLDVGIDERAIVGVQGIGIAKAHRRVPPGHIMIAWHHDRLADLAGIAKKHLRPLELSRARALTDVSTDRHDIELLILDEQFNGIDLQWHRRSAEMQVGHVQNTGQAKYL